MIAQATFGRLAGIALVAEAPLALRPKFSLGLPLSKGRIKSSLNVLLKIISMKPETFLRQHPSGPLLGRWVSNPSVRICPHIDLQV